MAYAAVPYFFTSVAYAEAKYTLAALVFGWPRRIALAHLGLGRDDRWEAVAGYRPRPPPDQGRLRVCSLEVFPGAQTTLPPRYVVQSSRPPGQSAGQATGYFDRTTEPEGRELASALRLVNHPQISDGLQMNASWRDSRQYARLAFIAGTVESRGLR